MLACGGGGGPAKKNAATAPADLPPMPELSEVKLGKESAKLLDVLIERLRQSPNESGLNGDAAMLLHSQGRLREADVMYQRARMLAPAAARWSYLHGVVLDELGRRFDAAEAFKHALSRNPKDAATMLRVARLYLQMGQESDNEALSAEGRSLLTRLLTEHPKFAAAHYEMAQLKTADGELEVAVNHYENALELGGSFGAGHAELADVYAELGEDLLAERHRALAIKRADFDPRFEDRWMSEVRTLAVPDWDYVRKGEELLKVGLLTAAVQPFRQAVAQDPDSEESRINLTALYGILGKFDEAKEQYDELIKRGANPARAHLNMGTIALAQEDWDAAIAYYEKAIRADPYTIKAYIGLSRAYQAKGNPAESIRQLELGVSRNRYFTATLTELAERLADAGRYEEAIERMQQAVLYAEVQESLSVMRGLAEVYHAAGQDDKAIETLEDAQTEARRLEDNVTAVLIRSQLREYGAL